MDKKKEMELEAYARKSGTDFSAEDISAVSCYTEALRARGIDAIIVLHKNGGGACLSPFKSEATKMILRETADNYDETDGVDLEMTRPS